MKQGKIKKGFTLVELLVVIAIIAILATVGILGYTSFTRKANIANDEAIVSQMNLALQANEALDQRPQYPHQAVEQCIEAGFILQNLTPGTSTYDFAYDLNQNKFGLLEYDKRTETYEVKFGDVDNSSPNTFVVVGNKEQLDRANQAGLATYLRDNYDETSIITNKGIDVGACCLIQEIKYINISEDSSCEGQNIIIRTNSYETELTVNAPKDVINHYDICGSVNIIEAHTASYHEHGTVPFMEVSKGRVALEEGANVTKLHFNTKTDTLGENKDVVDSKKNDEFDEIIIAAAEGVTLPEFSRDVVKIKENGNLVVELQKDTNNNENTESDYIWLYKAGVISQIVVVDEPAAKIVAVEQTDGSYKFFAKKADDTVVQEVVLGVTQEEKPTQKAAVEIANNYKGSHSSTETIGGKEVKVAELDNKGDIKTEPGKTLEQTISEFVEEKGLDETTKTKEKLETVAEAIKEYEDSLPAAKVNGVTYSNIEEVATIINKGELKEATIVLNKNLYIVFGTEWYFKVSNDQKITLDLNGYTIESYATRADGAALIRNEGALTLKDSTADSSTIGKGKITLAGVDPDHRDVPGYASNLIGNYGKLTVESGWYENTTKDNPSYAAYALDCYPGSNVTINGGKFVQNASRTYAVRMACYDTKNAVNLTINGGIIEGGYGLWLQQFNTNANKANLHITGGKFIANDAGSACYLSGSYSTVDFSNTTIDISGGEFLSSTGLVLSYTVAPAGDNYIAVTGGKTTAEAMVYMARELSADYAMKPNADGTYSVAKKKNLTTAELQAFNQTMEAAASCKIGEKFYTSLTRAIMEIKDGDTITLLKDIEFGEYNDFQTDRNIVIDFAGHKFYGTYSTNADYFVYSSNGKGSITFKNGTIDHAGKYSIYSTDSGTTFYLDNIILTAGTTNYSNACYVGGTYTYTTVPAGFKYYGYYSDGKLYVTNGYWYSYTPEQFANVYGYTYTGNVENKDFYQMDGYTTYIYMQGDTTCRGLSISNYSFHKISDPENCYLFYAPAYPSYLDDMSIPDGYCFVENGDMTVSVVKAKYIVQYQSSDYNNYVWGSYNTETEANEQLEYFIKNYGPGTSYNSPLSEVVRAKYAVVSTDGINYNEWYFDNLSDANDWIANYTEEVIQYYNLRVIEWAIED